MKRGFTLVELLGVIIVLGLIVTILTPVIGNTITSSREKAYESQVTIIKNAAKEWGAENVDALPSTGKCKVDLSTLKTYGKLQNADIVNPKTKEVMNGCVTIEYNVGYNQYIYSYEEYEETCNVATECSSN